MLLHVAVSPLVWDYLWVSTLHSQTPSANSVSLSYSHPFNPYGNKLISALNVHWIWIRCWNWNHPLNTLSTWIAIGANMSCDKRNVQMSFLSFLFLLSLAFCKPLPNSIGLSEASLGFASGMSHNNHLKGFLINQNFHLHVFKLGHYNSCSVTSVKCMSCCSLAVSWSCLCPVRVLRRPHLCRRERPLLPQNHRLTWSWPL